VAAVHESLHEQHAVGAAGGDGGLGFGAVETEGFFAEHVFAGLGGAHDPRHVLRVGRGHIDGLYGGVGEEGLVAGVGALDAVRRGKGGGLVRATAGDGDDASGLRAGDALGEGACDAARAEDAPVERRVHWEKG
jgi:hypothetical protein